MKLSLVLARKLRLRSWGVSNPFIIRQLIEAGLQVSITSQNSNAHHFCCVEIFFSTEVYYGWFNKHNSLLLGTMGTFYSVAYLSVGHFWEVMFSLVRDLLQRTKAFRGRSDLGQTYVCLRRDSDKNGVCRYN